MWQSEGALASNPEDEAGFLHRHLTLSRLLPPAPADLPPESPVDRLLRLAEPRQSPLSVRLEVQPLDQARNTRELKARPARRGRPLRLGDAVRLVYEVSRPCHVTLIDIGTAGAITVVLPNAWQTRSLVVSGGLQFLPSLHAPEFEFELAGTAGTERIVALATVESPPASLGPARDEPFRSLLPAEVDHLVDVVMKLDPAAWAASVCQFEVLELSAS
jgi:hypothetical protein